MSQVFLFDCDGKCTKGRRTAEAVLGAKDARDCEYEMWLNEREGQAFCGPGNISSRVR